VLRGLEVPSFIDGLRDDPLAGWVSAFDMSALPFLGANISRTLLVAERAG
jgi:hypothetical protein